MRAAGEPRGGSDGPGTRDAGTRPKATREPGRCSAHPCGEEVFARSVPRKGAQGVRNTGRPAVGVSVGAGRAVTSQTLPPVLMLADHMGYAEGVSHGVGSY